MQVFDTKLNKQKIILALGAESAGNFSVFWNDKIYLSEDYGDLLDETNFKKFTKAITSFLKKNKIIPSIVLCDLHPLYRTLFLGEKLSQHYKASLYKIQHHISHIFSAYGEQLVINSGFKQSRDFFAIASDGTGYGIDGNIWGGEVFKITNMKTIKRIGRLENQIMIGGDLAVREPARMLIAIFDKINRSNKHVKIDIYKFVKKYYTKIQFNVLCQQLEEKFNCQFSSSTGRVLDTVSLLLGFVNNKRGYKHEPVDLLIKNSSKPYKDLEPKIRKIDSHGSDICFELLTRSIFEYILKNAEREKARLAATAQEYLAKGLFRLIPKVNKNKSSVYLAGGMANNPIMAKYLDSKGVIMNQKIPRGDGGISFGQIIFYLLTNSRNQFSSRHVNRTQASKFSF